MPDASILLASYAKERTVPGADRIRELLAELQDRVGLSAPTLVAWECGNVVHGRARARFGHGRRHREEALEVILAGVELHGPDDDGLRRTAAIVERTGLTFYDAAYLEHAAGEPERVLLTEDRKLLEAGRRLLGQRRSLDAESALRALGAGGWSTLP